MDVEKGLEGLGKAQMLGILAVFYFITRIAFLTYVPFVADEGIYSVMIEEQIEHPTTVLTFLGTPVPWKPPLMFWTYGAAVRYLRDLPMPIEAVYRLPGTFFGLINLFLLFMIFEKLTKDRKEAFLICAAYLALFLPLNVDSRVLTDTMCGTALFGGVLAYMHGPEDRKMFIVGGLLTFAAYFIKQTNAAAVPVLAAAFLFEKDRKLLLDPLFLASLAAFPLASWMLSVNLGCGLGDDSAYFAQHSLLDNLDVYHFAGSLLLIIPFTAGWLPASIFGFWANRRRNLMMSTWYVLMIFPLFAGALMPFYFYPIMPAIAYFGLQLILRGRDGGMKPDALFGVVFVMLALASLVLGIMMLELYMDRVGAEKEAGELLAGKEDVMIVGTFAPGVFSYKMLEEKRSAGAWLDYGLIIMQNWSGGKERFIENYSAPVPGTVDGDFANLYSKSAIYRKETALRHFDYICVIGNSSVDVPGAAVIYNRSDVVVYSYG